MKNKSLLWVAFFVCFVMLDLACNVSSETLPASQEVQSNISTQIPATSQLPTAIIPTPFLKLTETSLPTSLPSPTPFPYSPTIPPFLPANLAVISPQNVSNLKQIAVLSEPSAGIVAYSPDNSRVSAGLFYTNVVKVWDLASGQELFTLSGHTDPRIISYLTYSPDGSMLASGAQGWDGPNDSLILWDARTGRELQRFDGRLGALSPDWTLVALTQREKSEGTTLTLSDLSSGEEIHSMNAESDIYAIVFSPDGKYVAGKMYSVFQDLFSLWSVETGRLERTLYDWANFSYSPDGRFIAALVNAGADVENMELNIFDAVSFSRIKTLTKNADAIWYTNPTFSPDSQILVASFSDHVTLWDTQTWKELVTLPVSSPTGFTFSPDGKLLTMYTLNGPVQLWGVEGP